MKSNILSITSAAMLLCGVMVTGCHDDNGNYTYSDLDVVEITPMGNSDGENDVFTLERGETLKITPEIRMNGKLVSELKDVNLSYMWTFYTNHAGAGVDYTIDTLAYTPELDVVITRTAGSYYAQLTVTNEDNGLESYYRAVCNVEEAISAGWMLIYERADRPGYSDVGLVVNPFSKKNIQRNKEFWNIYSSSNGGEPIPGKPVSLLHETIPLASEGTVRFATSETVVVASKASMEKVMDFEDLFYEAPQGEIQWFGTSTKMGCCEVMIMDNQLRVLVGNSGTGAGYFGHPKQYSTDLGELAAWSSTRTNGNAVLESVVYSQTLGAFFYTNTSLYFYPFIPQTAAFDVNDTGGARLLFGDWGMNNFDYMLFAKGDERYVGVANFSATAALPNIGQTWADVSSAPQIKEATTFAVNFIGLYAYYGAGNKIYNLDYTNGRATEAWAAPDSGEQVVCVRTHKYHFLTVHSMMMPNVNNIIHIATWNESKPEGKLYEYTINPASGQIMTDGESYVYTIPGKVADMGWKYEMAM